MGSNMDIKYIGSGEAVKALVFYMINYITKSSLFTYLRLQALVYTIKLNIDKYAEQKDTTPSKV